MNAWSTLPVTGELCVTFLNGATDRRKHRTTVTQSVLYEAMVEPGVRDNYVFNHFSLHRRIFVTQQAVPVSVKKAQLKGLIVGRGENPSFFLQQTWTGPAHTGH